MAFIDELRDTQSKNRKCAERYMDCIHAECKWEKDKGAHRISGYPHLDCEFYPSPFVSELNGRTGTPQQRAAYHRQTNLSRDARIPVPNTRGVHHGGGFTDPYHLVLKSADDAQQVKAMVEQQLREDGFTRFTIKIMPYYEIEKVYDIGLLKRTMTEVETGSVFYCLHVTVEW